MTKKLVIVIPYLKVGGTERQALRILRGAEKYNYDATLVVIEKKGALIDSVPSNVVYLNVPFSKRNFFLIVFKLAYCLRSLKPDLVVSRAWNSNLSTAVATKVMNFPSILFLSGNNKFGDRFWAKSVVEKFVFRSVSCFVALCNKGSENFLSCYSLHRSKMRVIYNGVDTRNAKMLLPERVVDKNAEKFVVSFMGSLTHRKGLDVLLKAMGIIIQNAGSSKEIILNVIGDGELRSVYERNSQELGLSRHVFFMGELKNPFPVLSQSDIFVLPSRAEGFPNALLEAMALGVPPVAARCETGPEEIIRDGFNGYLFPVEDYQCLSEIIKKLVDDAGHRHIISRRAKETVSSKFSVDKQMEQTFQVFDSCLLK